MQIKFVSHPTRVRGLKLLHIVQFVVAKNVAPHAGAWIETKIRPGKTRLPCWSHPTRVRGLKLDLGHVIHLALDVAPHAGAWIETSRARRPRPPRCVAPHAGAWIETNHAHDPCRPGSVAPHAGAWIETAVIAYLTRSSVAPHAGAWIETQLIPPRPEVTTCRTPRGCVD